MTGPDGFALTVEVPAEEWAFSQRRLVYLEGVLYSLVKRHGGVQEHFSAAELAALRLPGLPATAQGIARRATTGKWRRERGRDGHFYHVSCLPPAAFDALIARLLDVPDMDHVYVPMPSLQPPPPLPSPPLPDNAAPAWVLPLLRLVKGKAEGDIGRAWRELPRHLPVGVELPTIEEAAATIVRLGLAL